MDNPSNEDVICHCFQVTDKTIKKHIVDGNLSSVEEVTNACGAGGGCQSCHMLIELFIDQHQGTAGKARAMAKDPSPKIGTIGRWISKIKAPFSSPDS